MDSFEFFPHRRVVTLGAAALLAAALAGCASTSPAGSSATPQADPSPDALLKRAQAYWDRIKANDSVGAWPYEAQSKDPRWSLETYLKKGGVTYSSVQVHGVKSVDGDVGLVDIEMVYSLPLIRVSNKQLRTDDQWKLIDGVWYHAPPRSKLLPNSDK